MADVPPNSDQIPEKKKRRQNVACDSCRLRRVKCDMLSLLTPDDSEGSGRPLPPLHVLVREHPEISCSNCISKGIKCTTHQIVNPAKPNKGGKRIEEARKIFGAEGMSMSQGSALAGGASRTSLGDEASLDASLLPVSSHLDHVGLGMDGSMPGSAGLSMHPGVVGVAVGGVPGVSDMSATGVTMFADAPQVFANPHQHHHTSHQHPHPHHLHHAHHAYPQQPQQGGFAHPDAQAWAANNSWGATPFNPFDAATSTGGQYQPEMDMQMPLGGPPGEMQQPQEVDVQLQATWEALINPQLPNVTTNTSITYLPSGASSTPDWSDTSSAVGYESDPTKFPQIPLDEIFTTRSKLEPVSGPTSLALTRHHRTQEQQYAYLSQPPPEAPSGRKRVRTEESVVHIGGSSMDQDSWGYWGSDGGDPSIIRWSRAEDINGLLADRSLGNELSRHLVKVFFQAVHLNMPIISPESFFLEWKHAGERSDQMRPAQEALCAVMEAWAARYSDHPVILGIPPNKTKNAPKVLLDSGELLVENGARRAQWGKARLKACQALTNRARRLLDYHGILRVATVTGVQALSLYSQLQHMTDGRDSSVNNTMENRMIHAITIEQMSQLELLWDTTGSLPVEAGEHPTSLGQQRMRQRRIFWTMIVADAFYSAGGGTEPKIADEDLEASAIWLVGVEESLVSPGFKALAFFMSTFHRVAVLGRRIARDLAIPSKRPGRVDVADFCKKTRAIWRDLKEHYELLNVRTRSILEQCDKQNINFSPIHYIASLRQSFPAYFMIIHHLIRELLEFRRTMGAGFAHPDGAHVQGSVDTSAQDRTKANAQPTVMLEELNVQSVDTLLAMVRGQTYMFGRVQHTGIVQAASVMIRLLLATTQFLVEIPTNEQGYPANTAGGCEWTWENKQKEVGYCVEGLYQLGWAWADVGDVIQHVTLTMERNKPTAEMIAAFQAMARPPGFEQIKEQRRRELDHAAECIELCMKLYPPVSVPALVEKATEFYTLQVDKVAGTLQELFRKQASFGSPEPQAGHTGDERETSPTATTAPFQGDFDMSNAENLRRLVSCMAPFKDPPIGTGASAGTCGGGGVGDGNDGGSNTTSGGNLPEMTLENIASMLPPGMTMLDAIASLLPPGMSATLKAQFAASPNLAGDSAAMNDFIASLLVSVAGGQRPPPTARAGNPGKPGAMDADSGYTWSI